MFVFIQLPRFCVSPLPRLGVIATGVYKHVLEKGQVGTAILLVLNLYLLQSRENISTSVTVNIQYFVNVSILFLRQLPLRKGIYRRMHAKQAYEERIQWSCHSKQREYIRNIALVIKYSGNKVSLIAASCSRTIWMSVTTSTASSPFHHLTTTYYHPPT